MSPIFGDSHSTGIGDNRLWPNLGASLLLLNSEIPASLSHLLLLKSAEQESTLRNDEVYIILVRYPRLRPHSPHHRGWWFIVESDHAHATKAADSTDELINHIIFIYLSASIYIISNFL